MEGSIMTDIRMSHMTGIPFGNNAGRPSGVTGQPYFNGEEKRLELFTSTGWQNIVSETPGVVSVSGNYLESAGSATLDITGTNFTTGAIASVIGTNGVEVNANSTTVNSIVSITAEFSGLSNANEPYDVKVTNTSNLFGILPDALYINASPVWQTPSGSLGSFVEQVSISLSATATDSDSTVSYSLANGSSLPSGVSLNGTTGAISGTLPDITTDTTYTFTVNATDGLNVIPRTFSIQSASHPVAEILVIGGGGSGSTGNGGSGGGGAGGLVYSSSYALSKTALITIGNGAQSASVNATGFNGEDTVFGNITAFGGGAGKGWTAGQGGNGGSGGGGGSGTGYASGGGISTQTSPLGATGYGNIGGTGLSGSGPYSGGGGGGAGAAGGNGTANTSVANGGIGRQYSITGTATYYAGGGGSGTEEGNFTSSGLGGLGGGGRGGYLNTVGVSGTANTGGGGGGGGYPQASYASGAGGSGVVIIAYPDTFPPLTTIPGTLTYDQPTRAGYRVYRFKAGTGTISF
jgi:hypothetical protein